MQPLKRKGPYKRTLIAMLDAYPGGAGVDEAAGVDERKIKKFVCLAWRLVYPSGATFIFLRHFLIFLNILLIRG